MKNEIIEVKVVSQQISSFEDIQREKRRVLEQIRIKQAELQKISGGLMDDYRMDTKIFTSSGLQKALKIAGSTIYAIHILRSVGHVIGILRFKR